MEEQEDKLRRIVDFLDNKLTGESLEDFENQMATDTELKEEVQQYSTLKNGLIAYGEIALKDELEAIHQSTFADNRSRLVLIRNWGVIAAGILFLIMLAWWWRPNANNQPTFDKYYAAYTIPVSSRTTVSEVKLLAANALYQKGAYKEAAPLFQEIQEEIAVPDGRITLALGICYLELNQYEKAQSTFKQLINSPQEDIFQNLAQWYLALSYLKLGDIPNVKNWLETLTATPSADKYDEAKQLLQELN